MMGRPARIALALCLLWSAPTRADELVSDGIAAQVGNDIVLVSEVMERVADLEAQLREADAPPAEIAKLRAAGLEKLIESRLIDQIVRRGELYATDEEIDQAVESIAVENGITRAQLEETVVAQGMPLAEYRDKIKSSIEHQKVIRGAVASRIQVDETEVRALYDERYAKQPQGGEALHLRQILVTYAEVVPEDKNAVCARVHEARERVRAGESFEKLASEISEVEPAQGGDIGWLHVESIANWMREVVAPLKDGETSEVVELPFGCSMLKLVERKGYEPVSYEDAKTQLHLEVYQAHLEKEFRLWMEELRSQTFIERKGHFADAAQLGSESGVAGADSSEEGTHF